MAPALVEVPLPEATNYAKSGTGAYKDAFAAGPKHFKADAELKGTEKHPPAKYPNYLPTWTDKKYPPLEPFEHYEHGKDADSSFSNLLKDATKVDDLTANIGAEVHGVQLSKLTDAGKDELALFVAQKKVVAFRDQDFADLPISDALKIGGYFGRHHIHPTSGGPEGHPEVHLVHRSADDTTSRDFFEERTNSVTWHSDVTYEKQPPGTTFLYLLDGPAAGGDTLFANQALAYRRLSPEFQKRLHGLKVVHSAVEQADNSRNRGGIVRREPVTSIHPLVRTHPTTGEKALFINPQFSRRIVGYKKEESDYLLNFLYDHLAKGQDFQARVKWAPGTVVVWDNRVTAHSALLDWEDGARRHLARITPQAEAPYETPFEG
ncbi:TauD-domain-containing protein [Paraphaeosphaeria sporulosa]|uniref:TauD-domain-containing protein n=1 Tax=Paraphaeosphaeria sporulosa TaxID=1460663 RepID=A0A177CEM2_9PLEO|nr:TauD-domain-containing protein [Paraphaeosphaeria sporulosa]OAG05228.1 TauD-domain-containing protein [Paraphaeosphaeria sporulosa]